MRLKTEAQSVLMKLVAYVSGERVYIFTYAFSLWQQRRNAAGGRIKNIVIRMHGRCLPIFMFSWLTTVIRF